MYSVVYNVDRNFPGSAGTLGKPVEQVTDPLVLVANVDLKAGDVIRTGHLSHGSATCHANNPLTGPFSDQGELVGRVAARDIPAGTTITGSYLMPLAPSQMAAKLRNFWQKCR